MRKAAYLSALSVGLLSWRFSANAPEQIAPEPIPTLAAAVLPLAPVLTADVAPTVKKVETEPAAEPKPPVSVQTGVASWYEGEGVGKRAGTLTAAHRKLPFGTLVRVTNLANNRSTVVKINDRGPFIKGRVIDVNATAARQLAMINSGVSRVRLEVLPRETKGEF